MLKIGQEVYIRREPYDGEEYYEFNGDDYARIDGLVAYGDEVLCQLDCFITNSHKDECEYFGITDDMVLGTTDAMEVRVSGVFLTREGRIVYSYRVNTPIGTLEGIIRQTDTLNQPYTLF